MLSLVLATLLSSPVVPEGCSALLLCGLHSWTSCLCRLNEHLPPGFSAGTTRLRWPSVILRGPRKLSSAPSLQIRTRSRRSPTLLSRFWWGCRIGRPSRSIRTIWGRRWTQGRNRGWTWPTDGRRCRGRSWWAWRVILPRGSILSVLFRSIYQWFSVRILMFS